MYVFVQGNFTDARHALDGIEDCIRRGATKDTLKVYVTAEGDAKFQSKEPPVVEEPVEEAPKKGKKKDEGPVFDPNGYLYWAKIKKDYDVTVVDTAAIDSLNIPREHQLVLHGAKTMLEMGNMVLVLEQVSKAEEKFD